MKALQDGNELVLFTVHSKAGVQGFLLMHNKHGYCYALECLSLFYVSVSFIKSFPSLLNVMHCSYSKELYTPTCAAKPNVLPCLAM